MVVDSRTPGAEGELSLENVTSEEPFKRVDKGKAKEETVGPASSMDLGMVSPVARTDLSQSNLPLWTMG